MLPDVGVVMPVYKQRGSYLRAAIQSVLTQTYKKFKFVIVIDGAPPKIEKIVREEVKGDRRVRVIVLSQNQGVSAALNRGFASLIRKPHIRYLTWVSSDNIYYPNYLRLLRRGLRHRESTVGLAYSGFRHINRKGKPVYDDETEKRLFQWMKDQPKENLLDSCFVGVSFMYKRRYAEMIEGYYLQPVEDYDYWLRLTEHCDICFVPKVLMDYRVCAPYSISRTVLSSPEQHRRWRNAFQLAKYQARIRRNIPVETTVIFPIDNASSETIQRLESLYAQEYSNFKVVIIDTSISGEAGESVQQIPDPRISCIHAPGLAESEVMRLGLQRADTPFVMFYTTSITIPTNYLGKLVKQLRDTVSESISGVYYANEGTIHYHVWVDNSLQPLHLYRTNNLSLSMLPI